jgi:hypothetical protein
MRQVLATRYVTPLREGGSLPAIVEADDSGLYVVKFRGAGHGPRALVSEWIGGELARAAGLQVPEIVSIEIDPMLGRNEPDAEIRDLLRSSAGLNAALDWLPGSFTFDPVVGPRPDPDEASAIVWFDAWISNVDRTARNPNLLWWHHRLWLIDHGASLYFHHAWADEEARRFAPFTPIREHVLLPWASAIPEAGRRLAARLTDGVIRDIVASVPGSWLADEPRFPGLDEHRAAYVQHLTARRDAAAVFEQEAERVRASLV